MSKKRFLPEIFRKRDHGVPEPLTFNDGSPVRAEVVEADFEEATLDDVFASQLEAAARGDEPGRTEQEIQRSPVSVRPKPVIGAARKAVLTGEKFLPLGDPKYATESYSQILSGLQHIEDDQIAMVTISTRRSPDFRAESLAWQTELTTGEPVEKPKTGGAGAFKLIWLLFKAVFYIFAWLLWIPRQLIYLGLRRNPQVQKSGGINPPAIPGSKRKMASQSKVQAATPRPRLDGHQREALKLAEFKASAGEHFETEISIAIAGPGTNSSHKDELIRNEILRDLDTLAAGFSSLKTSYQGVAFKESNLDDALLGVMAARPTNEFVLGTSELAGFSHPPDSSSVPNGIQIARLPFKPLAPHNRLPVVTDALNPEPGLVPIGLLNKGTDDEQVVAVENALLDKHLVALGQTGTGKSVWISRAMLGIAKSDYPMVLLDPHNALGQDFLNILISNCPERLDDIVVLDLADESSTPALNPLDIGVPEGLPAEKHHEWIAVAAENAANQTMALIGKVGSFNAESQPRAYQLAKQAVKALAYANVGLPDAAKLTIFHTVEFFQRDDFRHLINFFNDDNAIRQQFSDEEDGSKGVYASLSDRERNEFIQPIVRIFNTLESDPVFRKSFVSTNKLDFARLISENKILICQLRSGGNSSAKTGELLAAMLLPALLSSMGQWGRTRDPETGEFRGTGARVIIDEAPAVISEGHGIEETLAEARKWDLGLILLMQFLDQLEPSLRKAVLNNTGSKIAFRLAKTGSSGIAEYIAPEEKVVDGSDFARLPNWTYYGNVLTKTPNGQAGSGPFVAASLPPAEIDQTEEFKSAKARVIEQSRQILTIDSEKAGKRFQGDTLVASSMVALGEAFKRQAKESAAASEERLSKLRPVFPDEEPAAEASTETKPTKPLQELKSEDLKQSEEEAPKEFDWREITEELGA